MGRESPKVYHFSKNKLYYYKNKNIVPAGITYQTLIINIKCKILG